MAGLVGVASASAWGVGVAAEDDDLLNRLLKNPLLLDFSVELE